MTGLKSSEDGWHYNSRYQTKVYRGSVRDQDFSGKSFHLLKSWKRENEHRVYSWHLHMIPLGNGVSIVQGIREFVFGFVRSVGIYWRFKQGNSTLDGFYGVSGYNDNGQIRVVINSVFYLFRQMKWTYR